MSPLIHRTSLSKTLDAVNEAVFFGKTNQGRSFAIARDEPVFQPSQSGGKEGDDDR